MSSAYQRQSTVKKVQIPCRQDQKSSSFSILEQEYNRKSLICTCSAQKHLKTVQKSSLSGGSKSDVLTYSQSHSLLESDDFNSLVKRLVHLLRSGQHIATHVSHSLGVKGFPEDSAKKIASVVAKSFGQYITIAEKISCRLGQEGSIDKMLGQKEQLYSCVQQLRKENERQEATMTHLQQQNDKLMRKLLSGCPAEHMDKQIVEKYRQESNRIMNQMSRLQIKVYQRLSQQQDRLLHLSQLPRQGQYSSPEGPRILIENNVFNKENQVLRPSKNSKTGNCNIEIAQLQSKLQVQQKLYDQLAEKNIALQRQLFFCQHSQGPSFSQEDSLHIVQAVPPFWPS